MFVWTPFSLVLAAPLFLLLHSLLTRKKITKSSRLPPGPPGWPFIGNLLDLGYNYKAPHKRLVQLQKKYGPVFMIRMGSVNTLVIASADAAMELFKNHDQGFSNRHRIQVLKSSKDHDDFSTSWIPYGPIWRMNRRLYATMFSRMTMKNTLGRRRQFVDQIIQWISVEKKEGRSVEIKHLIFVALANLWGNLFFSRDLMDPKSATGNELYQQIEEIGVLLTKPNLADFFPWLRNLDPQNLANRAEKAGNACENIIEGLVKDRRSVNVYRNNNEEKDFWDLLIDFEGNGKDEPRKLSDRNITLFILVNARWVMTEVVRNPEVMRKAIHEISQFVGYNRKIEESDIQRLPYLGAVIKEAMRLHPPGPLLLPRSTVEDTEFMGYIIPKDTAVVVNVWGIGRDSALWDDPFSFNPDRFLGNTTDYRGQHFEFLPFGAGRRMCPGLPMAHQIVHIVIGSLLQSFDWTLENGATPESIDMNEKLETSLKKSVPLRLIPSASALAT
ncbi:hypothetical protein MKW94_003066 [Papaver nudicaule]|uniref:N-methylcoclaurine 3'-monooxygenase n=1 Tax=Papaver nudicaule TaxID=74823 RepID=A0AA42B036_PAPNU|nr:hypothetical protein [Papaver nudicaule]